MNNILFGGMRQDEIDWMIQYLHGTKKHYKKHEQIIRAGSKTQLVGIVEYGSVKIIQESIDGKENIIGEIAKGDCFGAVFSSPDTLHSLVSVVACEKTEVLFLDFKKIMVFPKEISLEYTKVLFNLVTLLTKKNQELHKKIEILSKRTTRERLLLYFDSIRGEKQDFLVPLSREDLASYLCVDRSAMCNELSKMNKEGIMQVEGRKIILFKSPKD